MKDKTLRAILFGDTAELVKPTTRSQTFYIKPAKDGEKYRAYTYRKDDGLLLVFIEMIEKLEKRIDELEKVKIKK